MAERRVQRLKVWRWSGRDRLSLEDLEFLVASTARSDLHAASVRLLLPKPDGDYILVRPGHADHDVAVARPGRVLWRELDTPGAWQPEETLEYLRSHSTTNHAGGTPLNCLGR